jgi:hypothetical protein
LRQELLQEEMERTEHYLCLVLTTYQLKLHFLQQILIFFYSNKIGTADQKQSNGYKLSTIPMILSCYAANVSTRVNRSVRLFAGYGECSSVAPATLVRAIVMAPICGRWIWHLPSLQQGAGMAQSV